MNRRFVVAAALAGMVGCGYDSAAPSDESWGSSTSAQPTEKTGSLSFALTAQGGVEFDTFSYVISGPNFAKSGGIDVTNSSTVSVQIEGIPAGSGYAITLQGSSAPPIDATCSGSAPFTITAGELTPVPVSIACHVADQAPPEPTAVPIPPLSPIVLGLILLAGGTWRSSKAFSPSASRCRSKRRTRRRMPP